MSRLFWIAVGAAGGILVYRRGQQVAADARERGVVLTAQQVALSTVATVNSVRSVVASQAAQVQQRQGGGSA